MMLSRRVVIPLLLVLAAVVSVFTIRDLVGELLVFPARQIMVAPTIKLSKEAAEQARRFAHWATMLDSGNAAFQETAGDYELYLYRTETNTSDLRLVEALEHFHKATAQEPINGLRWAKIASIKASLGEFDSELDTAYQNAHDYGYKDYKTSLLLFDAGLTGWDGMSEQTRLLMRDATRNLYQRDPAITIVKAMQYGHIRDACLWVRDIQLADGYCWRLKLDQENPQP